jgi:hypothetical protein
MESPFSYGVTVGGKTFTNRDLEKSYLKSNFQNGIHTILISPRRWGKSSLVEQVVSELEEKKSKLVFVLLDLYSVNSIESFMEVFAKEIIKATSNKIEEIALSGKNIFKKIIPKISFGIDPNSDFSVSFDWAEIPKHIDELLQIPETVAQKKDIKLVICLDEFQQIALFENYPSFEKKMRAIWQRQKNVTYCLYGSKKDMMKDIFNNPSKPFYKFGDVMMLEKINKDEWVKYIISRFRETKKRISPTLASKIAELMDNHSWYVQQLSHFTWLKTEEIATESEINKALEEVIYMNTPFFQHEYESLNKTQVNLLKAIADGQTQLTSMAVIQKYNIGTSNNILKNKVYLMKKDIIDFQNNTYQFLDPVFRIWFERVINKNK